MNLLAYWATKFALKLKESNITVTFYKSILQISFIHNMKLVTILNKLLVDKNWHNKEYTKFYMKMDLLNLCHVRHKIVITCASSNMFALMLLNPVSFQRQTGSYTIIAVIIFALCSSTQIQCSCFSDAVVHST
jgi:hypothetical protein